MDALQTEMGSVEEELHDLQSRAENLGKAARQDFQDSLDQLQEQKKELEAKLESLSKEADQGSE